MRTSATGCVHLQGYIKEGRTHTGQSVSAHLTINLSKLPSAPDALLFTDICPTPNECEGSACANSADLENGKLPLTGICAVPCVFRHFYAFVDATAVPQFYPVELLALRQRESVCVCVYVCTF